MEPTLQRGSYILGARHYRELNEGDVIIFRQEGQLLVKRIAGCPGDKIDLRNLTYMASRPIPVWEEPVFVVPENSYFVLGDNVQNSIDSRYWEDPFVRKTNIVAKLIWPFGGVKG